MISRPRVVTKPSQRLGRKKRVTIALGLLAGNGIVLAADSEETIGIDKVGTLKTKVAFPLDGESAFAITGAGNGWYIDAIAQDL